ncbi:DUF488 domain-containing protein [Nocardia sp. NPDC127579]|uniref:DUF488 domain-containing protein n=1 Tax=Nocardia sp. NPDC127579 TaxID=3345402 RepID=UPI00362E84FB
MTSGFAVKRAYDGPDEGDGYRVLVDRLWPRGVSKEEARIDEWAKDVTPSGALRTWFHHDPGANFDEFVRRYEAELAGDAQRQALTKLRDEGKQRRVTLVTAAKDPAHSHVAVLLAHLR